MFSLVELPNRFMELLNATLLAAVVLLLSLQASQAADASLPKLLPAYPDADSTTDSAELLEDEPVKPSSLPARKLKTKRTLSQQTSYDSLPIEEELIVSQSFLDERESAPLETRPATKAQTKKKTNRTIETAGGTTTPPSDYSNDFVNIPKPQTLNGGEFFVADTEYPIDGGLIGGVYNEVSPSFAQPPAGNPALNGSYAYPMLIKSFGSGVMDNLTFFGGVSGFKAETDFGTGTNGSFGFNEGFNWSAPATPQETVYAQAGFRAIQSGICGNTVTNNSSRNQFFVTAGLFKRISTYPLQAGAVIDYLNDDLMGKTSVSQARYELSARTFSNLEYGFLGTVGLSKQSNASSNFRGNLYYGTAGNTYSIQAQQSYQLFVRKHFAFGGSAEVRSGATENGDALLAAAGEFPVSDRVTFNGGFSALIPKEGHGRNGWKREAWNVSVGIVFYFRGGATAKTNNLYRPMFDVAGNGTFYNRFQ